MTTRSSRGFVAAATLLAALGGTAFAGHYSWTTTGPEPGTIYQILLYPQAPGRLYTVAGFYGGHAFRSTDNGASWCFVEGIAGISSFVADPTNPDVLYAISHPTVVKTENGMGFWHQAGAGLPEGIFGLALARTAPHTLYAIAGSGAAYGVYRSDDGAASWNFVPGNLPLPSYWNLTVDAIEPETLYATNGAILYRSFDGGATWNPAGAGLPTAGRVFTDPRQPGTLWMATVAEGLYRSLDGGTSFAPAQEGIENQSIRDLAFDASDPARLYAATDGTASAPFVSGGLFVSTNSGGHWTAVDLGLPPEGHYASAVALDPASPERLFVGASIGGAFGGSLLARIGGGAWTHADQGLSGHFTYAVAAHPTLPGHAFTFSFRNFFTTQDSGANWTPVSGTDFGSQFLLVDPTNAATLFTQYSGFIDETPFGGVYRSIDGGATWSDRSSGLPPSFPRGLAIGVSDPATLVASTEAGVFATHDAGGEWTEVVSGIGRSVAVDPQDSQILYASRQYDLDAGQAAFLRSSDGGATWQPPAGLVESVTPIDLAIPADDSDIVYALLSDSVYKSIDRGLSFVSSSSGLEGIDYANFYRLALDPSKPTTLYAAMNYGAVYRSTDASASWRALGPHLPFFNLLDLAVDVSGRTLWAASSSGTFQFERSFLDVPDTDSFWTAIDKAAMNGVTVGCGGGNFCPAAPNTRAQIAPMLLRAKETAAYVPPAATGVVFSDVPATSFAAAWIEELARRGISSGCGSGSYCPGAPVTRAMLAVMLLKAKHGADYAPPPATGIVFSDVPADAFAAAWIEELWAEGITAGCGGGRYCPGDPVLRAQAAALIVRTFGLS